MQMRNFFFLLLKRKRDVLLSVRICVCCARLVRAEGGRASRQCKPRDKRVVAVETSG